MIIYFTWDGFGEVNVMKFVNRIVSKDFVYKYNASLNMSQYIIGVLNCSL